MEKVVDSVQQILSECDEMLAPTTDCEYADVKGLAKTLKDDCEKLRQLFEISPDDVESLRKQKQCVERTAIRLEFYLFARMGLYKERKELRSFAGRLYDDCRTITYRISRDPIATHAEVVDWASYTGWALALYERSLHIVFELSEADEAIIKDITTKMNVLKEDRHYE